MDRGERRWLRDVLRDRYPWIERRDAGPWAVTAGECDRCGQEARLVETCGPVAHHYLGRSCAAELGVDAWCTGHEKFARDVLGWLADLPDEADDVARLWWIATGEVRVDAGFVPERPQLARVRWKVRSGRSR